MLTPSNPASVARRLWTIEALRGCAASSVVLFHVSRHLSRTYDSPALARAFQFGGAGVDLFFVISGFVIAFIHWGDLGRPDAVARFCERRFTRVYPLFWAGLGVALLLAAMARHEHPHGAQLLWAFTLIPGWGDPWFGVAWTLQMEVAFYAAFAVGIISRRAGMAVLCLWVGLLVLRFLGLLPLVNWLPRALASTYNLEFAFGIGVALMYRARRIPAAGALALAGVAGFVLVGIADGAGLITRPLLQTRLPYGLPATLLVAGLVELERSGRLSVAPWLRRVGAGSYSIYLFHLAILGVAWQGLLRSGAANALPAWSLLAVLSVVMIGGGVLLSEWVEQPLLRAVREAMASGSRRSVAGGPRE